MLSKRLVSPAARSAHADPAGSLELKTLAGKAGPSVVHSFKGRVAVVTGSSRGIGLGIAREQVMAFGDNTNDLPMLAYAGASVAMENGEKSVRRAARFIAPHHDGGGVGKFLFEKVLL